MGLRRTLELNRILRQSDLGFDPQIFNLITASHGAPTKCGHRTTIPFDTRILARYT